MNLITRRHLHGGRWIPAILAGLLISVLATTLASAQSADQECRAGLTVGIGESCTYPGTDVEFSVGSDGLGRILIFASSGTISIEDTTINGVAYNFVAKPQGDGTWLIEVAGDSRITTTTVAPTTTVAVTTTTTTTATTTTVAPSTTTTATTVPVTTATTAATTTTIAAGTTTTTTTVGGAPAPDLVVRALSLRGGAPTAGERFTLEATVHNQGDGRSDSTRLRYYRSADSSVTTGDTEVGSDYVSRLSASADGDESVRLTAPSTAGTYYYGACVDAVSGESDTSNNCSPALAVTVAAKPVPDLVVGAPALRGAVPAGGGWFTLEVTVHNRGDGRSGSTRLRYYLSSDSRVTTGDTEVGTDYVSRLSASGDGDESVRLRVPAAAGTYYYGACVDAVSDESDTTNNCSSALAVAVGGAPTTTTTATTVPTTTTTTTTTGATTTTTTAGTTTTTVVGGVRRRIWWCVRLRCVVMLLRWASGSRWRRRCITRVMAVRVRPGCAITGLRILR